MRRLSHATPTTERTALNDSSLTKITVKLLLPKPSLIQTRLGKYHQLTNTLLIMSLIRLIF